MNNVPKKGPLLITPNHQNALLDALLVGAFMPQNTHFLARQDVFTSWSKPILKALKMMPVFRIRDGYASLKNNNEVFDTCTELFSQNESVLMFPEGNHGEHYFLRPLTKGAARIALQAQEKIDSELMIQPVGLNYFDHFAARSTVLIVFGKPIKVSEFLSVYRENEPRGLIELRDSMSWGMKETLVIPEDSDDYDLKKRVIFHEKNDDLSFQELKGLPTNEFPESPPKQKKRMAKVLNPIPFILIKRVLSKVDDIVFHSSLKFAIGLIAFPIWWTLVFMISSLLLGTHIGALLVFTMIVGLFYSYQEW